MLNMMSLCALYQLPPFVANRDTREGDPAMPAFSPAPNKSLMEIVGTVSDEGLSSKANRQGNRIYSMPVKVENDSMKGEFATYIVRFSKLSSEREVGEFMPGSRVRVKGHFELNGRNFEIWAQSISLA